MEVFQQEYPVVMSQEENKSLQAALDFDDYDEEDISQAELEYRMELVWRKSILDSVVYYRPKKFRYAKYIPTLESTPEQDKEEDVSAQSTGPAAASIDESDAISVSKKPDGRWKRFRRAFRRLFYCCSCRTSDNC